MGNKQTYTTSELMFSIIENLERQIVNINAVIDVLKETAEEMKAHEEDNVYGIKREQFEEIAKLIHMKNKMQNALNNIAHGEMTVKPYGTVFMGREEEITLQQYAEEALKED